jgi:hypothetical protein
MVDIERVVSLNELVDLVPEQLIREAEQNRLDSEEIIDEVPQHRMKDPQIVNKDLSKAQRIRSFLESNPGVRNRDVVESLRQFKVTSADVANVKSLMKKSGRRPVAAPKDAKRPPTARSESTAIATPGASITLPELEAGVAFVKAAGSLTRAKHVLIIIEQIKDNC